ncbi:MAG: zf-HC2 domain-containing protein [candidate division Zixibacteria bacterium]|nr:zf-HC2 domain-containing protein [candidate division Zixibacteria bacterium]
MFTIDKCEKIKRLLSDRIDTPLSERLEKKVRHHLEHCDDCRREADFYELIKADASKIDSVTPPDFLWERISLSIEEHPWGEDEHRQVTFFKNLSRLLQGSINYAGAALTFALIALLCLMPGGSSDRENFSKGASIRAEEIGTNASYVSLYMMSHRERFPYEVQDYYLNKLGNLDQQIKMIKSALDRFPNNHQMSEQLVRTYAKKLKLYHQLGIASPEDRITGSGAAMHIEYDVLRGGQYE